VRIYSKGRILHRGRSIVFLERRLLDAERKLLAIATATARAVPKPKCEVKAEHSTARSHRRAASRSMPTPVSFTSGGPRDRR
jgi:hypothetical protein